nr:pseudouridine synthase [Oscillibacter sp.]
MGRLDLDSEGLLLLTNDGAWAQHLLHPKHEVEKTYHVSVFGPVAGAAARLAAVTDLEGSPSAPPGWRCCGKLPEPRCWQ